MKNLAEVEELKRNRQAREAAREDFEMIKRDEERRLNSDWDKTEEDFLLSQAKLRSRIRLKEGRGKPIDFLARYVCMNQILDLCSVLVPEHLSFIFVSLLD